MLQNLKETYKSRWNDELEKLVYAYCTEHSMTRYSVHYLLFGGKPKLPVDFILKGQEEIEEKDQDYNNYSKMWKGRTNETYKIANQNTKDRRHQDKTKKDIKATLLPVQVGNRILVRDSTPREGSSKLKSFQGQEIYVLKEIKDPENLLYTMREQDKANSKSKTIHRNNIMP